MKHCTNCGAQIPDGSKFCTECGQKVEQAAMPVQVPQEPEAYVHEQPMNPNAAVASELEAAPAAPVTAPVFQQETPAQNTHMPQFAPQTEPVQTPKKKSGKKLPIPLIIGVVAVAVVILLVMIFGGGGGDKNDPNLGMYNAVSCVYSGLNLGAEGEWIELKSGGKATLKLMGDEYSCKWKLDGEELTITQAGDTFVGTLKDGTLVLDFEGMIYTYEKEGYSAPVTEAPEETNTPEVTDVPEVTEAPAVTDAPEATEAPVVTEPPVISEVTEVGYWTLKYSEGNEEMAMDEDTVAMLKEMGIVMYVDLKEDGTGTFMLDDVMPITWGNGKIVADDGSEVSYTLESGELIVDIEGAIMHFVPGEGSAPAVTEPEAQEPENEFDDPMLNFWDGDWYGWWVVWDGDGTYAEMEDKAWDAYAHIDVNDDYTGTVTLWEADSTRQDPIAVVDVSFRSGVSENGCMVSESGWFMDCEVTHADWNLDVGASMVRMFDSMIAIDSYYYDPADSDNNFNYVFILRPWGMDWEDVRGVDADGTYYSDMMPIEYDDWYLPLINKGVAKLPDSHAEGVDLIG